MHIYHCISDIVSRRKKLIVRVALIHTVCCVVFWLWMFAVVFGLGFKNPHQWSTAEQVQAMVIPQIALLLTTPARFLFIDGWLLAGISLLASSVLWSVLLVVSYDFLRSKVDR